MSVNSSSSNDSQLHLPPSVDLVSFALRCLVVKPGCFIFSAFAFVSIFLLLPLYTCVLHRGLQQWRKQRFSTAATHSDAFTYHLVVMELSHVFGCVLCVCGIYKENLQMIVLWFYFSSITFYGETFFHVLTCLELYLAVVHPIAYLSLRKERWIRIRTVTVSCIWLLSCGWTGLVTLGRGYLIPDVCLLIISVLIMSFCSLSVLWALVRPGPGKQGRDQVRLNQSKQKAFYTMVAILGVLLLRCVWGLVAAGQSVAYGLVTECTLNLGGVWISLPGCLLLPLLFMQRTGSLACCKTNIK